MKITFDFSRWWRTDCKGLTSYGDPILWVEISNDNDRTVHINALIDHRPEFAEQTKVKVRELLVMMGLPTRLLDISLEHRGLCYLTWGEHQNFMRGAMETERIKQHVNASWYNY